MLNLELLAPAGNIEKLKTALIYGADAVYFGGSSYGLRAFAGNFSNDEISEAIEFTHKMKKKAYVTINIFPHNKDFEGLNEYLEFLHSCKVDAVIVSDLGIFSIVKELFPDMEVHISTQANNVNYKSAEAWYKMGAKRVVLARELSLEEIREIREKTDKKLELEAFVHGAMCISYSGRCLLSSYMTGRDSNRGECAHPCRYKYYLMEEKRPGQYMPVYEDNNGTYIMNSKDLCMIEHIEDIIEAGVTSLKIEGRMKSAFYVASVVKAYRRAIDEYIKNKDEYEYKSEWMRDLEMASHREYSTGFYYNNPSQIYENSAYIREYDIVGMVLEYDNIKKMALIEQRNKVNKNDTVNIYSYHTDTISFKLENIYNENGESIESVPHPQMKYLIDCKIELKPYDMLIKKK